MKTVSDIALSPERNTTLNWTTRLAQPIIDWHKNLRNHGIAATTPRGGLSVRGHMLFNKHDGPDVGANSSPGSQNRDCDKFIIDHRLDRVRGDNALIQVDDDGHGGKLAFLACLYKRLYPKIKLAELIHMNKGKSPHELTTSFYEAIFEKTRQPTNDLTMLIQLCTGDGVALQIVDHTTACRIPAVEILDSLRLKFPGHLDSINLQNITSNEFTIIVGYLVGRTQWAPSPEASIWDIMGLAKAMAIEEYQPRVAILLEELSWDSETK